MTPYLVSRKSVKAPAGTARLARQESSDKCTPNGPNHELAILSSTLSTEETSDRFDDDHLGPG